MSAPISVIIPAYNRADILPETLASVLNQTLPVAEIIVVDDGSEDATAAVAAEFGARALRQPNQGVSHARNNGIRAATQPYIALLDSDDLWERDKIEKQWQAMQLCKGAGFSFTDMLQFDDDGVVVESFLAARENFAGVQRTKVAHDVACCDQESLGRQFFQGNFISPSSILADRDLLLQIGLFDIDIKYKEDRDFCLRLIAAAPAVVVERVLVRYRLHGGGKSRRELTAILGSLAIGDRVMQRPDVYPTGAVDHYRSRYPGELYAAGVAALDEYDFALARRLLWASLRRRPTARSILAFAVSLTGRRVSDILRRIKRRTRLPGFRPAARDRT